MDSTRSTSQRGCSDRSVLDEVDRGDPPFAENIILLLRHLIDAIVDWELLILAPIYAWFVIFDRVPLAGWLAIAFIWVARRVMRDKLILPTALGVPIYCILVTVPVGLYASVSWQQSLPKAYGMLLGIAVFHAIANRVRSIHDVRISAFGLVLAGMAISFVGLLGIDWLSSIGEKKVLALSWVYENLPQLIDGVPRSLYGGFTSNAIAGTLAFIMPAVIGFVVTDISGYLNSRSYINARGMGRRIWRVTLAVSLITMMIMLILTQSRGAILGIMIGVFAFFLWYDRRFVWIFLLAPFAAFALAVALGIHGLDDALPLIDPAGVTISRRVELWQRGIWMVQDFPYTGIGIANFDLATETWYPLVLQPPDARMTHAHNDLLQVAVDFGIPGLVAYVALLTSFVGMAWRAYQWLPDSGVRILIVGLVCGMLAHQVFGLTDAFQLGTKPGVVMWGIMGLVAALDVHRRRLREEISDMKSHQQPAVAIVIRS